MNDFTGNVLGKIGEAASDSGEAAYGCAKVGCCAFLLLCIGSCIFGKVYEYVRPTVEQCSSSIHQKMESYKMSFRAKQAERKQATENEKAQKAIHEAARAENEKRTRRKKQLEEFAAKESPRLWNTLKSLQAEIDLQNKRIDDLARTLTDFGKDPVADKDYQDICAKRDTLSGAISGIMQKLEDAYIAAKKFEATPGRKDYAALRQKAIEDGIQEADAAAKRFEQMRENK